MATAAERRWPPRQRSVDVGARPEVGALDLEHAVGDEVRSRAAVARERLGERGEVRRGRSRRDAPGTPPVDGLNERRSAAAAQRAPDATAIAGASGVSTGVTTTASVPAYRPRRGRPQRRREALRPVGHGDDRRVGGHERCDLVAAAPTQRRRPRRSRRPQHRRPRARPTACRRSVRASPFGPPKRLPAPAASTSPQMRTSLRFRGSGQPFHERSAHETRRG